MRLRNSAENYGLVSKLLHWSIASTIIGLIALGWYMVDLSYFDRWYNQSLSLHKSFGMLVLGLALALFAWKRYSPSPPPSGSLPRWQRVSAHLMHIALMIAMIVIPLSGYLISTSAGQPVAFFGMFEIPPPAPNNKGMRDLAIAIHYYSAYGVAGLVAGHAGAAIKHELIDRDGSLARMIWR